MSKSLKTIIWALWLVFVPLGHWAAFMLSPPVSLTVLDIFTFYILCIVVACLPLKINNVTFFMIQWLSIAAFLTYGLFFEMILSQIATVVTAVATRSQGQQPYRYLLYSFMFFLVSFTAGFGFFVTGGELGAVGEGKNIGPVTTYIVLHYTVTILLHRFVPYILNQRQKIIGRELAWEAFMPFVIYPLGIGLYFLNQLMGPMAFFLIGIPFISSLFVLKMNENSRRINNDLQKAASIGHLLTGRLHIKEVLKVFIHHITETIPIDHAHIMLLNGDNFELVNQVNRESDEDLVKLPSMPKDEGIAGVVFRNKKGVIYSRKSEWEKISFGITPSYWESVMCVPILRDNQIEGVLFLTSVKRNAFRKYQLMIANILSTYLGVALNNARDYEDAKRKSEFCALTKIPNYRFFKEYLSGKVDEAVSGKLSSVALIIIDIDHFKNINDTYGHQSGDQVLIQLANLLRTYTGTYSKEAFAARYGGEEFVIVLSDAEQNKAREFADFVRNKIAETPFFIHDQLKGSADMKQIRLTASMGVATCPAYTDRPEVLIQIADRSLYIGAKQAGRNKVAPSLPIGNHEDETAAGLR